MAGDPWDADPVVSAPSRPVAAFTDTGRPGTADQERTVRQLAAAGGYSRDPADAGTSRQPYALRAGDAPPSSGFYMDQQGLVHQAGAAPASQPDAAAPQAQPAAAAADDASPWAADPVVHTAGYAKAMADQQATGDPGVEGASDAFANGLTLNNADRLKGGLAAAGTAIKYLLGDHSVTPADAYAAERDLTRQEEAAFSAKHPVTNFALTALGGAPLAVATGGLLADAGAAGTGVAAVTDGAVPSQVARVLTPLARGTAVSSAIGAGYGAGADKADPLRGANDGADMGAALGVAAPIVLGTAGTGLTATRAAVNQVRDALTTPGSERALTRAGEIAAQYLGAKLEAAGLTPADVAAHAAAGRGATVAEAMGPDAVADAAAFARRPGQSAALSRETVGPESVRAQGRTDRLLNDVTAATGVNPETAQSGFESIVEAGQKDAAPHYAAMDADPNRYMTPQMRSVLQSPAGKSALAQTYRDLQNAEAAGKPGPAMMGIAVGADGVPVVPKGLRPTAIDMVKRNLDVATKFQPLGGPDTTNANKAVDAVRDAWVSSARKVVPNYDDALSKAADYKQVEAAYKGTKGLLFSSAQSPTDVQTLMGALQTSGERQAVQARMAADLMAEADAGRLTPAKLRNTGAGKKLDLAFGPGTADKIASAAGLEAGLSSTGARMTANTGAISSDALMHAADQDATMDTLRAGMHAAHRLKEGKWLSAVVAAGAHAVESSRAAAGAPQQQAVRDAIGRLYFSPAREFRSFTPPKSPAASAVLGYLRGAGQLGPAVLPNASALREPDPGR